VTPRRWRRPCRWLGVRDDRGSAGTELVVMSVVFVAFVLAILFAGRVNVGYSHVEAAARAAARTITIDRDPAAAVDDARAAAADVVKVGSAMCQSMSFDAAISETEVTVDVTCVVDLSEAGLIGVPGSTRVEASATEVIDQYREQAS
jgi:Flp pilus assembly protein TadG